MAVTQDYVDNLPEIYRDVLSAFQEFDPTRQAGDGLAFQSLYSVLADKEPDKYTLGEIRSACLELEKGKAVEIKHEIFAHPTELGEELIEAVTGKKPETIPPFEPPAQD